MPSHYLKQCWNIVNWKFRNKFQWNLKQHSFICIQENGFENIVCELAAIWSRPQCVKNVSTMIYDGLAPHGIIMQIGHHYVTISSTPDTSVSTVCSTVCSSVDQWKYQNSASLDFVRGIHRSPVDSSHKGLVTRKMFTCDDVIMCPGRW